MEKQITIIWIYTIILTIWAGTLQSGVAYNISLNLELIKTNSRLIRENTNLIKNQGNIYATQSHRRD